MTNEPENESPEPPTGSPAPEPKTSKTPPPSNPVGDAQGASATDEQFHADAGDVRSAAEKITPAALVDGEMPEPSEHVVAKYVRPHRPDTEPKAEAPDAGEKTGQNVRYAVGEDWRDKTGEKFVPTKHQHRNGRPELTPKGYLKRWGAKHRKAGVNHRPEGLGDAPESAPASEESKKESLWERAKKAVGLEREKEPEPAPEPKPGPTPEPEFRNGGFIGQPPAAAQPGKSSGASEATQAAAQLVAMEEMIAVMVFSEEWQFLDEERKGLVMAWTRAFEEKGIVETPWWMELGAAHAVVFASRANKPKTREKLGKMKGALMKKVIDFRTARAPQQKEVSDG